MAQGTASARPTCTAASKPSLQTEGADLHHVIGPAVGLACWLVSLLLYSNSITPFQRLEGTASFVGLFAERSLAIATLTAILVAAFSLAGRHLPAKLLLGGAGALYVAGAAGFAAACFLGLPEYLDWLVWALAFAAAVGSVGTGLAWGRVFKGFCPRTSLAAVALAALMTALLGLAAIMLPPQAHAALFVIEAAGSVAMAAANKMQTPMGDSDHIQGREPRGASQNSGGWEGRALLLRRLSERLGSLSDVAAPALVGLLAFAYVMGTMRVLIVDTYRIHLGVLVVCSVLLGTLAFGRSDRPFARVAYRSLIPTLAVLLLAVTNVTMTLYGGSWLDMVMIFLMYTLAALLTLATLSAIAHANEFPSDLVFSIALTLFCLASLAGLASAEFMGAEEVKVSTAVITTLYAFAMVLLTNLRASRAAALADSEGSPGGFYDLKEIAKNGGQIPSKGQNTSPDTMETRCRTLAEDFRLTAREEEILTHLAKGHSSAHIGEVLYISPNTVRTHVHNLYRKLGVNTRDELTELVGRH